MKEELLDIRLMRAEDIPDVLAIQALCYDAAKRESGASFGSKLAASPAACFVARDCGGACGYLVSVPALINSPPALHAPAYAVPPSPDTLYLHDLAVRPDARGKDVARTLIKRFFAALAASGLAWASLPSVNDTAAFRKRYGFSEAAPSAFEAERVGTYGENAVYMVQCADNDRRFHR